MVVRNRRRTAVRLVLVVALAILVDPLGAVQANEEIERARSAEKQAGEAVAEAEARLAARSARLDDARVHAAGAVEAYNGARAQLAEARLAEDEAANVAARTRDERDQAQAELGRLAAAAYRNGGGTSALSVVINTATDAAIVDVAEAIATVARSQATVRARWATAAADAASAAQAAERVVAERVDAEQDAELALLRAQQAVLAHEEALADADAMRDALVADLAAARGTTAELEQERQQAIALQAQEEREQAERARAEQERAEEERAQREQAEAESAQREQPGGEAGRDAERPPEQSNVEPEPEPAEPDSPAAEQSASEPADDTAPASNTAEHAHAAAAERAIAYAHAQLGTPYLWAGAGPGGFDCSGLTMRAWEQGGVQLTHWSVAQARQTVPVSFSDLRPGDLIFWSENGAPSGTYHVGLYIGAGKMIHAPSPGSHVEIQDVFYWRTPSFYGRVAP